jgi:hypothetical protein
MEISSIKSLIQQEAKELTIACTFSYLLGKWIGLNSKTTIQSSIIHHYESKLIKILKNTQFGKTDKGSLTIQLLARPLIYAGGAYLITKFIFKVDPKYHVIISLIRALSRAIFRLSLEMPLGNSNIAKAEIDLIDSCTYHTILIYHHKFLRTKAVVSYIFAITCLHLLRLINEIRKRALPNSTL